MKCTHTHTHTRVPLHTKQRVPNISVSHFHLLFVDSLFYFLLLFFLYHKMQLNVHIIYSALHTSIRLIIIRSYTYLKNANSKLSKIMTDAKWLNACRMIFTLGVYYLSCLHWYFVISYLFDLKKSLHGKFSNTILSTIDEHWFNVFGGSIN